MGVVEAKKHLKLFRKVDIAVFVLPVQNFRNKKLVYTLKKNNGVINPVKTFSALVCYFFTIYLYVLLPFNPPPRNLDSPHI